MNSSKPSPTAPSLKRSKTQPARKFPPREAFPPPRPDFVTDSVLIDSSPSVKISPPKGGSESVSGSGNGHGNGTPDGNRGARPTPKSRQSTGGTRRLAAAFAATAHMNDENQKPKPTTAASAINGSGIMHGRPQAFRHGNSKSLAGFMQGDVTPSPSRTRRDRRLSPKSTASSPPRGSLRSLRGLRNYQRSNKEGSQKSHSEDYFEDIMGLVDELAVNQRYMDYDRERNFERSLETPPSLKWRRGTMYDSPRTNDIAELEQENEAQDGEMDVSISDLGSMSSFFDTMTDRDLAAKLAQHARDEQRMSGAISRNTPVFGRFTTERPGLTFENLQRREQEEKANTTITPEKKLPIAASLPFVGSPKDIEGSMAGSEWSGRQNVPRAWGRHGKARKEWLKEINRNRRSQTGSPNDSVLESFPQIEKAPLNPSDQQTEQPGDDWVVATAANVPLPSTEGSTSSQTPATSDSIISSTGSLDKLKEWEYLDQDFTARSLQVSQTPTIKRKIDRIQDEIDALEKRGVAKGILLKVHGKASLEQLRRTKSNPESNPESNDANFEDETKSVLNEPQPQSQPTGDLPASGSVIDEKGNTLSVTPVVDDRSRPNSVSEHNNNLEAALGEDDTLKLKTHFRPPLEKQDSRDVLRRLSRVTSASPNSPGSSAVRSSSALNHREAETSTLGIRDPEKHGRAHSDGEIELPSTINIEETPQMPKRFLPAFAAKTPVVTGAWIDTPYTQRQGRPSSIPSISSKRSSKRSSFANFFRSKKAMSRQASQELKEETPATTNNDKITEDLERPEHPRSALEEVITGAKKAKSDKSEKSVKDGYNEDDMPIGDDTIASLEELLQNGDATLTALAFSDGEETAGDDKSLDSKGRSLHRRRDSPDPLYFERLNSRLRLTGLSIRDTKRGISKLEHQVARGAGGEAWSCSHCGGNHATGLHTGPGATIHFLAIPVPKLWNWKRGNWLPRLTWLGWFVFTLLAWYTTENMLCEIYCHPLYATEIYNYGVDLNAPRMPWVTVTMLGRWTRLSLLLKPLMVLFRFLARLFGYGDETSTAPPSTSNSRIFTPRMVVPTVGVPIPGMAAEEQWLGMNDDEYL
ncbi:MAG: hypothetical protein M1834_002762 [Cirrosporium novae-zelandiae]|nr:MAG: hypothetical protein M1834_002762 [Cirrosporium novae-zelandiae]